MNVAIKTRLDAIDAQMAELQKEQAKLREELDKPEFVPGRNLEGYLESSRAFQKPAQAAIYGVDKAKLVRYT